MDNFDQEILTVSKQRGRSSNTLKVITQNGETHFIPESRGNRHYQSVLKWIQEGGKILPPPPKPKGSDRPNTAYLEHPNLITPHDDTIIWRYMSFEQLVSLLINKALWFSRGNTLQNMDPYEGQLPESNLNSSPDDLTKKIFPNLDLGQLDINKFYETHRSFQNNVRVNTLICCWNMHNHESYSMWKVYGKTNNCVAIKTTIGNLKKAFGHYTDYDIFIGQIRYIDFDIQTLDESNYLNLFFSKTPFYSSEQEVRCIILDDGDISLFGDEEPYIFSNYKIDPDELSPGVQVPCDTTRLIEEVVIGPDATPWFHSVVKDTLNQFGYINTKTSISRIKP